MNIKDYVKGDNIYYPVLEMSLPIKPAESELIILFTHLLKYDYQSYKQTRSWITSIRNSSKNLASYLLIKSVYNVVIKDEFLNNCFRKAIVKASNETSLPKSTFPANIPKEYSIEHITDSKYIEKYLDDNAKTDEAKRLFN